VAQEARSARTLHLVDLDAANGAASSVAVPDGPGRLADDDLRLDPGHAGGFLVEPVRCGGEPALLVTAPEGRTVRLNGALCLGAACVRPGEVFQAGRWTLHVAERISCAVGRAPKRLAQRPCPVCRRPVAEDLVYVCAVCGAATHCDRSEGGRLCLLGRACPACQATVVTEGFRHLPEAAC